MSTEEEHGMYSHVRKIDFPGHTNLVSGEWILARVLNNCMRIRPGRSQLARLAALEGGNQAVPQVLTSG